MTRYKFKGYTITNCGYHQPDHCVWWEAVNENGEACFHGNTLREVEFEILDYEWEQKMRKKEEEIELLKESMPSGDTAAMREALEYLLKERDILDFCHNNLGSKTWEDWDKVYKVLRKIIEKAMRALAAPPRNCDIGTADEQAQRYDKFCEGTDCVKCPVHALWHHYFEICKNRKVSCGLIWAQMPYEEKDGGAS